MAYIAIILLTTLNYSLIHAQCYPTPSYCTPTFSNVAGYSIGLQNVTLSSGSGASINNNSVATGNAPNYFDYTLTSSVSCAANGTITGSVKNGSGNSTGARIYVDYNRDGTFGTSAPELVWSSGTTSTNSVVSVSFTVPIATAPGTYRMRVTGDIGGSGASPCALGYGEAEDYMLVVTSANDASVYSATSPMGFFSAGLNTIGLSMFNLGTTTMTSVDIGYQLDNNSPVTQSITSLSVAAGAYYSSNFATQLNIPGPGTYTLKMWLNNVNGAGTQTAANDTMCRTFTYCAMLNGSYTIDPAGSGPNNYTSFASAISALQNCGISGPVVFNIASGTYYNTQFTIPLISGSSSTNTITFDGGNGNAATRTISFRGTVAGNYHTVRLDGTRHIRLRNLTIRSTDPTNGWPLHIKDATNIGISNCIIKVDSNGATASGSNLVGILINGSNTALATVSSLFDSITIDSSTIRGGYYGIYSIGVNGNGKYVTISNSSIDSSYLYGLYFQASQFKIRYNNIRMRMISGSTTNYGCYFSSCASSSGNFLEFNGNKILNAGQYGVYFSSVYNTNGTGASPANQFYNNMIGGNFRATGATSVYGFYSNSTFYPWDFYNNTISVNANTTGANRAFYLSSGTNVANNIKNNIFAVTHTSAVNAIPVEMTTNALVASFDYNNLYSVLTNPYLYSLAGANYKEVNMSVAFPNGAGTNSVSVNPQFISTTDLHKSFKCLKGTSVGVTTDIDRNSRASTPNMGADEVQNGVLFTNDIGIDAILSPANGFATGTVPVRVRIKNYGSNTITSCTINYSVNGGGVVSQAVTGISLNTCDTVSVLFSTSPTITSCLALNTYTTLPNGGADGKSTNDGVIKTILYGVGGTYTIDAAGSGPTNYTTFNSLAAFFSCGIVTTPVTVNIASNTYNEQVAFNEIIGTSATNTVTFDGGSAASTTIKYNATVAANSHTLRYNFCNYINLRNLTILSRNGTNGWPLHIKDSRVFNVSNCIIKVDSAGATATGANLSAVTINGSNTSLTTQSTLADSVNIDSCTINGGYYGVLVYGVNSSIKFVNITNSTIDSSYFYGTYYNNTPFKIKNNLIRMRYLGSTGSYGSYFNQCIVSTNGYFLEYSSNKIYNAGQYGVYIQSGAYNSAGTGSLPANQFYNNMIGGNFRATGATICWGFYNSSSTFYPWNIYHNTFNMDAATTGANRAFYLAAGNATTLKCVNNIFAVTRATATNSLPAQYAASVAQTVTNNNYYNAAGTNLVTTGSGTYVAATIANSWPTGGGTGSVNVNPIFTSSSDLHTAISTMNGANLLSSVSTDIEGHNRLNPPDMGADEIPLSANVGVTEILPANPVATGVQSLSVRIKNYGVSAQTNIPCVIRMNGAVVDSVVYTGTLNPGDSDIVPFSNTYNFTTCVTVKAYTNLTTDGYRADDSITSNYKISISGVYTINSSIAPSTTNFVNFSSAISMLSSACNAIGGPVVFLVSGHTYTEQVSIPVINNVSATNTITFVGQDTINSILTFAGTAAATSHTLLFNGCQYINFRNMRIRNTGATYAVPVYIFNSNNNSIRSCVLEVTVATTATTAAGVVLSGSVSSFGTATTSTNNYIDSCRLNAGGYNIYHGSNNTNTVNYIRYNLLMNANSYVIYSNSSSTSSLKIIGNTFLTNATSTSATCIYMINGTVGGAGYKTDIQKNIFLRTGNYYINILTNQGGSGSGAAAGEISNNFFGGTFNNTSTKECIRFQGNNWNIYHNTFYMTGTATTSSACINAYGGTNAVEVKNNILVNMQTGGNNLAVSSSLVGGFSAFDYNLLYTSGANLMSVAGSFITAASMNASFPAGAGLNSINTLPTFVSTNNLHISNACYTGTTISSITSDIDGDVRNSPAEMGADEFIPSAYDLSVVSLSSPVPPINTGANNVRVLLKNLGANNISSANISYILNGASPVTQTFSFSPSLSMCDTVSVMFSTPASITGGSNTLKVYTAYPSDGNLVNDTIQSVFCPSMSGTYTINQSGSGPSNYTSFASAMNALACGGVSGPVVFNVSGQTYTEQISINAIGNASSTNTITFIGQDTTNSILTFAGTAAATSYTVLFNGCQYVNFRNMRIENTGATYAVPVYMVNASNNSVSNCVLNITTATTANTASGIVLSGSVSTFSSATTSTNNYIDSTRINAGGYNIFHGGNNNSTVNYIRYNNLMNANTYAIYGGSTSNSSMKIVGNTFMTNASNTSAVCVYLINGTPASGFKTEIQKNVFYRTGIYYIQVVTNQGGSGTGAAAGEISNNFFGGVFNNTATKECIRIQGNNWNIYHNNFYMTGTATTSSACINANGGTNSIDVRNNILVNIQTGGTNLAVTTSLVGGFSTFDYNIIYSAGLNIMNIAGSNITAANMNAAFPTGAGLNTSNQLPVFTSVNDLHISNACYNGITLSGITTDLDGDTRLSPPDIGADEFTSSPAIDLSVNAITSPSLMVVVGTTPIRAVIKNVGTNVISSASVSYILNGASPVTQVFTFSPALNQCDTATVTFSINGTINSGLNSIKLYTAYPSDANLNNDTVQTNFCPWFSGNYTIDPIGSGPNNFTSFTDVVTALTCGGVFGPTVFYVAGNTFTEQISIPAIAGASASNTITFVGQDTTNTILTFAGTAAATSYTVLFNGCQYVNFRNMRITNSGATYAVPAYIFNANNNSIRSCVLEVTVATTATTAAGVALSGSISSFGTATTSTNNYIDSCRLNAGGYNISHGSNTNNTVNYIRYNKLMNANTYSIYGNQSSSSMKIIGNTFMTSASTGAVCIYLINGTPGGGYKTDIQKNTFLRTGAYFIHILTSQGGSGSGAAAGEISNNFFGGTFNNGSTKTCLRMYGNNWNVYNNSFYMTGTATSSSYCIDVYGGTNTIDVKNNKFINMQTGGTNLAILTNLVGGISTFDYNILYTGSSNLMNIGGTIITTSSMNAAFPTGAGLNSKLQSPYYTSSSDLHISNPCYNGTPLTSITTDIDGDTRMSPPDIGADEVGSFAADDIGVFSITSPAGVVSGGSNTVKAIIKNYGSSSVSNATVYYIYNGGSPVSQSFSFSPSLSQCDTATVTFTVPISVSIGSNNLKVYTDLVGDTLPLNDTIQATICPALSGTYTIDASGSGPTNFTTFANAISQLTCSGVNGAVTFNIAANTYNEAVQITSINGASSSNTITFQSASGIPSDVVIANSGTVSANYTMWLNNASYLEFKNLTISATGGSYGTALLITANSSYDSFYNVVFNSVVTTTNSTNLAVINSPSGNNNFLYFDTCRINNGSYGTYFVSSGTAGSTENLTFNNCDFVNQYAYGMNHNSLNGLMLTKNRISTNSTLVTYIGMYNNSIYIAATSNTPIINANKITGALGGHGMHNVSFGIISGTSNKRPIISNNMIQLGSGANPTYGIRVTSDNGSNYIHNSVNIGCTQVTNASAAAFFESVSASSDTVINNNFTSYNGAPAIRMDAPASYTLCNNNNYYTTTGSTFLGFISASSYTTLLNWQSATSRDAASKNVNPFYTSNTDLHSNSSVLNNAGIVSSSVLKDFDGVSRCPNGGCPGGTSLPDIGCDEYIPIALDASILSINTPTSVCVGSSNSVQVTLKNIGSTTLTSDSIGWSVNGVIQPTYYWSGSLTQGSSTTVNIGSFTAVGGVNLIKVWASYPNNGSDGNLSNDTASLTPTSTLNGLYTIGGVSPSFATFTDAVSLLNSNGVCGPVTFYVRQGTYSERIQLNTINGSSATNFITFEPDPANTLSAEISIGTNSAASDNFTIFLNGTSFIKFRGLKITNTSTGGFKSAVKLALAQDSVVFVSNIISSSVSASSSLNESVINSGNIAIDSISRFYLDSNIINNGSIGIYLRGNTAVTPFENKNKIRNNQILGSFYYGVYCMFQRNIDILNNTITMSASSSTGAIGIYFDNCDSFRIEKNYINNFGQYGVYMNAANYQGGTGAAVSTLINNMIGGNHTNTGAGGIYINPSSNRNINIYHNSVSISSTGYAIFLQQTSLGHYTAIDIKNNSFANFGSGQAAYLYFSTGTPYTINYNNYFTYGSTLQTIQTGSSSSATQGSPTYNANSKLGNPNYRNNLTDLRSQMSSSQLSNSGTNLASVTDDIQGETRPLPPASIVDIGADEYSLPVNDAGGFALISPNAPLTPGLQDVTVQLKNYGTATLSATNVNYRVGVNGSIVSQAWSGSIATNATSTSVFTGANQYNFTGLQTDTVYIWTDNPNTVSDDNQANDTSIIYICSQLNGVYTIDAAGSGPSNFTSFGNAITALTSCGVSGQVVFNVAASTYTEQISIPTIQGASATNTITFDGGSGNASTRILANAGTFVDPYTLRLNATQYITFRNLTVRTTGASDGVGVHFYNALNCKLNNCIIDISGSGATSTATNFIAIAINNGTNNSNYTNASTTATNNLIDSCTINAGYYGIYSSISNGTLTNTFERNTLSSQYNTGAYFINAQVVKFRNNNINMRTTTNNDGVVLSSCNASGSNYHELSGNKIINAGSRGIFLSSSNGSGSAMGQIYNNMIGGGFRATSIYGIHSTSTRYNIWHNSINIDNAPTTTSACIYLPSGASLNDIRNNMLAVSHPSAISTYCIYTASSSYISTLDNNNYWNPTNNVLFISPTIYTNSTYKAAFTAGGGLNSNNLPPYFVSATNLHTTNPCNTGANLSITTDFDGDSRGASPIIGADEANIYTNNILVDSIIYPVATLTSSVSDVIVRVKNIGTSTLSSFNLSYRINGGSIVTNNITSVSIASCDTQSFTFTSVNFPNAVNVFKTFSDNPNGSADGDLQNDTFSMSFCAPLSGTYTIGGASPSFATFTEAVAALNCGGISGPVVFNVRAGTYNEQVSIGIVNGSSSTNTITFQSQTGVASSVTMQSAAGTYVIDLLNADYITLKNLTLKNTAGGQTIQLRTSVSSEKCENVTVRGCLLSSNWGVSSNNSPVHSTGNNTNLKIKGNTFTNCYGIYFVGNSTIGSFTSGLEIDSNTYDNSLGAVFFPLNISYATAPSITYNNINKTGCCADHLGDIGNISGALNLAYNKMSTNGGSGLKLYSINRNGETTYANIYNNFIVQSYASANIYGLSIEGSRYTNVYSNNINVSGVNTTMRALDISGTAAGLGNVNIKNNILSANTGYGIYFNNANAVTMVTSGGSCNNNNYFVNGGTNVAYVNGSNYTTLASFQGALYTSPSNNDANSLNVNPNFTSATDLHIPTSASAMVGMGDVITTITTDIDNSPRAFPPCIGADEVSNVIRTTGGDYQVSSSCPTISGTNWITLRDASGNLLFSINPNGNNLGSTCYGIRLYTSSGLRTDSTKVYNSGVNKFGYFLDRNFYITPTTQPTTPVTIRFYAKNNELQELKDSVLNKYATAIDFSDIEITKFSGSSDLDPKNNSGTSANYTLLNATVGNYGADYYMEVSTPSFSEFNPSYTPGNPISPLPVTWSAFNAAAKGNDAYLMWTLASEFNNEVFEIERSIDGQVFTSIGQVLSRGNSIVEVSYHFVDFGAAALTNKIYYRIKQVDANGNYTYSDIRSVNFIGKSSETVINAWPNPATNEINIAYHNIAIDQPVQLRMMDMSGKVILSKQLNISSNNGTTGINLDGLVKGVYIVEWMSGDFVKTIRFVKQ